MKNIYKHKKNIARVRNCPVWCECSSNLTFSTATKNPAQLLVKMMHHPQQKLQPVPGPKTAAIYLLKQHPPKQDRVGFVRKQRTCLLQYIIWINLWGKRGISFSFQIVRLFLNILVCRCHVVSVFSQIPREKVLL